MKNKRRLILCLIDILILIGPFVLISCLTNFTNYFSGELYLKTLTIIPLMIVLHIIIANLLKIYTIIWRYANGAEFLILCLSTALVVVGCFIVDFLWIKTPDSVNIYSFSATTSMLMLILFRICYILLSVKQNKKKLSNNKSIKKVLIIGAGYTGRHILSELLLEKSRYLPVGFVDDDVLKQKRSIEGKFVVGLTDDIPELCKIHDINTLIFAIPSCDKFNSERILNICMKTKCEIKIIPYFTKIIARADLLSKMRNVRIEDLLGRDSISLDNAVVADYVKGKTCIVTGGGGSIGSELCRQIAGYAPKSLIILDIYENSAYDIQQELIRKYGKNLNLDVEISSVMDEKRMEIVFEKFLPDIIFHAAAHKHVPLMETNPEEAIKNNVTGTLNLVKLSDKYKVKKFILISSDKAVNPTNVMGASKRICEMILCAQSKNSQTEFAAVRFGNVLGSNGSVIPLFKSQIENGGPVTITHPEIIRFFMTIPEAVSLVLNAGALAKGGEIFILDMGKPVKIVDLAYKLIKLSGYEPDKDIKIEFTGLRPGEKLYEELMLSSENVEKTVFDKVFIGEQNQFSVEEFYAQLNQLLEYAFKNDKESLINQIKIMLPNFKHAV